MYKPITYAFKEIIPLPKKEVWALLSDTDHLNRFIGLFPVTFSLPDAFTSLFYRKAKANVFGFIPLEWQEYPFEWVREVAYSVERRYGQGPIQRFYGGVRLEAIEKKDSTPKTEVTLFAEITPRNGLGFLAIPLIGKRSMKKTFVFLHDAIKGHESGTKRPPLYKSNETILEKRLQDLQSYPVNRDLLPPFKKLLLFESEDRVINMRPYEWADKWNADRFETLRLFLYATKVGLIELSWHLLCPNCRVSKAKAFYLKDVKSNVHCDFCGVDYDVNFDQYVEVRFSVHPAIRVAYEQTFCVSGPQITPHIAQQIILRSGESSSISKPIGQADYQIRVLQKNWKVHLEDLKGKLMLTSKGIQLESAEEENGPDWMIENATDQDFILVLEDLSWTNQLTTAQEVTSLQEFRDLFSSEVLSPGTQVKVDHITLLFSDLKGSTALYEQKGDAKAYSQVRHHFDLVTECIRVNRGAIVKTIGDAVMAVFAEPQNALLSALQIQQNIAEFNQTNGYSLRLKLGLHMGPVIAVNSNDRLDYFGRTVNMAARIQGLSQGDDILISQEVLNDPQVKDLVSRELKTVYPFYAELKGVPGTVPLIRLLP